MDSDTGRLLGIAMRAASRASMTTLESADVTNLNGLARDFRGKPGVRQVTVLFESAWRDACAEVGSELPWTVRRANLFIGGIEFDPDEGRELVHRGRYQLQIGELLLKATGETTPCARMDEQQAGLTKALTPAWRGGLCCQVISAGQIKLGDEVKLKLV